MVTNTFYKLVFPRDALINCPELVEEKVRKGFSLRWWEKLWEPKHYFFINVIVRFTFRLPEASSSNTK